MITKLDRLHKVAAINHRHFSEELFKSNGLLKHEFTNWATKEYKRVSNQDMMDCIVVDTSDLMAELKNDFMCVVCLSFASNSAMQCVRCEKMICLQCFNSIKKSNKHLIGKRCPHCLNEDSMGFNNLDRRTCKILEFVRFQCPLPNCKEKNLTED